MLAQKLAQRQLQIKEISSDGHCMYRAVEDQLARRSEVLIATRVLIAVIWIAYQKCGMQKWTDYTSRQQHSASLTNCVISEVILAESSYSVFFCCVWFQLGLNMIVKELRSRTAEHMRGHADDFLPFLTNPSTGDMYTTGNTPILVWVVRNNLPQVWIF